MKSELILSFEIQETIEFPILAKCIKEGLYQDMIVLFTKNGEGTVVLGTKGNDYKIGNYSDGWDSVCHKNTWEILPPGTVVKLTQE